jgi:hypothetical protein
MLISALIRRGNMPKIKSVILWDENNKGGGFLKNQNCYLPGNIFSEEEIFCPRCKKIQLFKSMPALEGAKAQQYVCAVCNIIVRKVHEECTGCGAEYMYHFDKNGNHFKQCTKCLNGMLFDPQESCEDKYLCSCQI